MTVAAAPRAPVCPADCVDALIARVGKHLVVGTPLGLGKANFLLNELFRRACADGSIELTIFTALTLEVPKAGRDLEGRFLGPLNERLFAGYPDLAYAAARRAGTMPANVRVHEFFLTPGKYLNDAQTQRDYISSNYTHVARDMHSRGVNVVVQMISPGRGDHAGQFSLSCNPDVTLDLVPMLRAADRPTMVIGEINDQLPFMFGDAQVDAGYFDLLCAVPNGGYTLFGTPKTPVSTADHAIGLHVSTLVPDGGTLQVGIGSMGDAVVNALVLRHTNNRIYREVLARRPESALVSEIGGTGSFDVGLYGATEMLVDGFVTLYEQGILSREVFDDAPLQEVVNGLDGSALPSLAMIDALVEAGQIAARPEPSDVSYLKHWGVLDHGITVADDDWVLPSGARVAADVRDSTTRQALEREGLGAGLTHGVVAHGGFFLGPAEFYQRLRDMPDKRRARLPMTSVGRINQLYGGERLDRAQRLHARFINSSLMVTLNGAVVSDGLADGRVVSGVGGQYNFVAMAHALPGGRSIIKVRATRKSKGRTTSNIVFNYAHATIPRHLRDIVVTEYGIADLRGKSDGECAAALIAIADARFQPALADQAMAAGKLPADFTLPSAHANNTPQALTQWLASAPDNTFERFPFGTDLTGDELELAGALQALKAATRTSLGKLSTVASALASGAASAAEQRLLERLDLAAPATWRDRLNARLVLGALRARKSTSQT